MNGDKPRLEGYAAADRRFEHRFEGPHFTIGPSRSGEQLLGCVAMACEFHCRLRAESGQAAEDEYFLAGLKPGHVCQDGVVLRHWMLRPLINRGFARPRMVVHNPRVVVASDHGEVAAGRQYTQGWVLRDRADEDKVVQLRFIPGHQHAPLQNEMRVMPVEELREVIDTGELADAGVGVDIVVWQGTVVRIGWRRILQPIL